VVSNRKGAGEGRKANERVSIIVSTARVRLVLACEIALFEL